MNLFVLGPRALGDWISQMIETTRPKLASGIPPIRLELVENREEADCLVRSEAIAQEGKQWVWLELPDSDEGHSDVPPRFDLSAWTDSSAKVQEAFHAAAVAVHRNAQMRAVHRVVAGPFAHDVRGALSVVSLSRQLLDSGGDGRPLGAKLKRVDSKVTAALFDLSARTRCVTGAWPPPDDEVLAPTVDALLSWFADVHPDRTWALDEVARTRVERAPSWFCVALGGALDGVARLSRGTIRLEVAPAENKEASVALRITGETSAIHPAQRSALSSPDRWALVSTELVPYRLATAALLVLSSRGTVDAEELDGGLSISLYLP